MTARNRARARRRHPSPPEIRLWLVLRTLRPLGLHFRREHPFAGYYLDFACLSRRLVIEVDGQHHGFPDQARHDARRDAVLGTAGFLVLRYPARDVFLNLEGVVEGIIHIALRRPKAWGRPGSPPPVASGDPLP